MYVRNTDEDSNERAAVEQSPITNILHTEEAEAEDEDSVEEEERANNISIVKDDEGIQQEDVLDYEDMDDFQGDGYIFHTFGVMSGQLLILPLVKVTAGP